MRVKDLIEILSQIEDKEKSIEFLVQDGYGDEEAQQILYSDVFYNPNDRKYYMKATISGSVK